MKLYPCLCYSHLLCYMLRRACGLVVWSEFGIQYKFSGFQYTIAYVVMAACENPDYQMVLATEDVAFPGLAPGIFRWGAGSCDMGG